MKPIIFWGATGQAKVLRECIVYFNYQLVAIFDNNPEVTPPFTDVPLYLGIDGFKRWLEQASTTPVYGLIAIGGAHGRDRIMLQSMLEEHGVIPVKVIHPTAFVAADAKIMPGSQILANSVVGVEAQVGTACIINTAASIDHEVILGEGVHVAPGATLAGCVTVGDYTMIGAGAVVLPRIRIGSNVIVGAGAVVTHDIPDGRVVYGNPARIRRSNI